tara:strand:+ start:1035 stop:1985 length:951 start_codon:yes stop_codon:yes gene_type:complete
MHQQILLGMGAATSPAEGLFSVDLYTGTQSTKTITNDINLSSDGGLVWIKKRNDSQPGQVFDTVRGVKKHFRTDGAHASFTTNGTVNTFNTDGFTLGHSDVTNETGDDYCAWTFGKASKFLDIVSWTGNWSAQTLNHSLGTTPGLIIAKQVEGADNWHIYTEAVGNTKALYFGNSVPITNSNFWNNTSPTSTQFTIGSNLSYNNRQHVAYLFPEEEAGLIKCSTYTGNSSTQTINCGFKPQFLLIKCTSTSSTDWQIYDTTRGMTSSSAKKLRPNDQGAEINETSGITPASNGFTLTNNSDFNDSGQTYFYMAIVE